MRRSLRAADNVSLDIAVQAANGKLLVVFFAFVPVANAKLAVATTAAGLIAQKARVESSRMVTGPSFTSSTFIIA